MKRIKSGICKGWSEEHYLHKLNLSYEYLNYELQKLTIVCPTCNGSGGLVASLHGSDYTSTPFKCVSCNGKGKIKLPTKNYVESLVDYPYCQFCFDIDQLEDDETMCMCTTCNIVRSKINPYNYETYEDNNNVP